MEEPVGQECDICGENHDTESCPELLQAEGSTLGILSRARLTLPHFLQVADNPDGSCSVTAQQTIAAKTKLGPYEARKSTQDLPVHTNGAFLLKVLLKDGSSLTLDTRDENQCNWLCLVQTAFMESDQNCIAIQMGLEIYYMTIKEILPGTELRVWYSPIYAKKLGMSSTPDGISKVLLNQGDVQPCPELVSPELSQALVAEIESIQGDPSVNKDDSFFSSPSGSILDTPVKVQTTFESDFSRDEFGDAEFADKVPRLMKHYTCPDCGLIFAADFLLDLHSLVHQTPVDIVLKEEEQGKETSETEILDTSTPVVALPDSETAPEETDPSKIGTLPASQRVIHKPGASIKKCRQCNEEFADVHELAKHVKDHLMTKLQEQKRLAGVRRGRRRGSGRGRGTTHFGGSPSFPVSGNSSSQDESPMDSAEFSPVQRRGRGRPRGRPSLRHSSPRPATREEHSCSQPEVIPNPAEDRGLDQQKDKPPDTLVTENEIDNLPHSPAGNETFHHGDISGPDKSTSEHNDSDSGPRRSSRKVQIRDIVKEAMKVLEDDTEDVEDLIMEAHSGIQIKKEKEDVEEVKENDNEGDGKERVDEDEEIKVKDEPPRKRRRVQAVSSLETKSNESVKLPGIHTRVKGSVNSAEMIDSSSSNVCNKIMGPPMTPPRRSGRERRPSIKLRDISDTTPTKPNVPNTGTKVLATVLNIPSQKEGSFSDVIKIKEEPLDDSEPVVLSVKAGMSTRRKSKIIEEESNKKGKPTIKSKNIGIFLPEVKVVVLSKERKAAEDSKLQGAISTRRKSITPTGKGSNSNDAKRRSAAKVLEVSVNKEKISGMVADKDIPSKRRRIGISKDKVVSKSGKQEENTPSKSKKGYSSKKGENCSTKHQEPEENTPSTSKKGDQSKTEDPITSEGKNHSARYQMSDVSKEEDKSMSDNGDKDNNSLKNNTSEKIESTLSQDKQDAASSPAEDKEVVMSVPIDDTIKNDLLGGEEEEDTAEKENELILNDIENDEDPDWIPEEEEKRSQVSNNKVSVGLDKCDRCDVVFEEKDGIISHVCTPKSSTYPCKECGKKYSSQKFLDRHMIGHRDFSCKNCLKAFISKQSLDSHICQTTLPAKNPVFVEQKGTWYCEFCGHSYNSEKYLLRHMAAHTGEFKCKVCNNTYARKESLMRHILRCCPEMVGKEENQMEVWSCDECGKVFTKESSLVHHRRLHEKNFKCDNCEKAFSSAFTLKNHVCGNNEKPFKCPECGKCFSRELYMNRHRAVHLGTFSCSLCGKFYTRKQELVRHSLECNASVQIKKQGEAKCSVCNQSFEDPVKFRIHYEHHTFPFKCTECGKLFARRSNLTSHKCEPWNQESVECSICHKIFSHPKYLEKHFPIHGEAIYGCDICGKKYRRPDSLNLHVCINEYGEKVMRKKNSEVIPAQSVICPICGKKYVSASNLNKHMITHGEKNEICPECGKKFHLKIALKEHMKHVHTDKLNYQCKHCGKLMKCRNSLFGHIRQFHGDTVILYACEVCGKQFRQKGNLKKHMFQHEDTKRFSCHYCERLFKYPEQRRKHELWHQHGQRFLCSICDRKFVMQHELKAHMAAVHSGAVYICKYCNVECRHTHTMKRHLRRRHNYISEWQSNPKQFVRSLLHQSKADDHGHMHRIIKEKDFAEVAGMTDADLKNLTIITTNDQQQATVPGTPSSKKPLILSSKEGATSVPEQPIILAEVSGINDTDESQSQTVIIQTSGEDFDPEALVQEVTMTIIGDITQADGQTVPVAFSDSGDGQSIIFVPMVNQENQQIKTEPEMGDTAVQEVMTPGEVHVEQEEQLVEQGEQQIQYVEHVDENGQQIHLMDGQQIQYIEHIEQGDGQIYEHVEQDENGQHQVTYVEQIEYVEQPEDQEQYEIVQEVEGAEYVNVQEGYVDPSQIHQVDPSQIHQVDPSQIHQVDPSQIHHVDQSQIHQVDPSQIHQVDPSQIQQVDPSQIHQVDPSQIHQVDPSQIHQVDPSQIHQVDPSQIHQVDPSQIHQVDPSQIHQVDPSQIHQVDQSENHEQEDKVEFVEHLQSVEIG